MYQLTFQWNINEIFLLENSTHSSTRSCSALREGIRVMQLAGRSIGTGCGIQLRNTCTSFISKAQLTLLYTHSDKVVYGQTFKLGLMVAYTRAQIKTVKFKKKLRKRDSVWEITSTLKDFSNKTFHRFQRESCSYFYRLGTTPGGTLYKRLIKMFI